MPSSVAAVVARLGPPTSPLRLTQRQAAFVDEYLIDLCATKAAIRAGYSAHAAKWHGSSLLEKPHIEAAIEKRMALREKRTRVKAYRVLEELATVAFSNIDDYEVSADGEVTLREGANPDAMRAVAKVKHKVRLIPQGRNNDPIVEHDVEIALWDKNTALTNSLRHLGMLKDVVETRDGTLEDLLRAAAARRDAARVG